MIFLVRIQTAAEFSAKLSALSLLCAAASGLLQGRPAPHGSGHVLPGIPEPAAALEPLAAHQLPVHGRRPGNANRRHLSRAEMAVSYRQQRLTDYCFFLCGARQDSLPEKLAVYEKNIDEFDAFVDMLQ